MTHHPIKDALHDAGRQGNIDHSPSRRKMMGATASLGALSALGVAGALHAQEVYPSRTIKMIVPWPPGQATDLAGRALAMGLSRILGQTVVVENKAGAGGMIGTDYAAKAAGDGYTILAGSSGPVTVLPLLQSTPYDVARDFIPVAMMGLSPYVLVTAPDFPARDAKELVKMIQARPGAYTFASSGTGATDYRGF
jgi:tripartite-type tricarboxylate transporter receptor subunit TctC